MSNKNDIFTNPAYAKLTPANFALYCSNGRWKMAKHLALLNRELVEIATGRNKRLLVSMPPRPQPRDSKVLMANGQYKAICLVKVGDEVISHKGVPRKVLDVIDAGVQPIITLRSARGLCIRLAETHRIGIEDRGWVEAKDVVVKDRIVSLYNIPIANPAHLEKDVAYNLGLFTALSRKRKNGRHGLIKFTRDKIPNGYNVYIDSEDYLTKKGQGILEGVGWIKSKIIPDIAWNLDEESAFHYILGFLTPQNRPTFPIMRYALDKYEEFIDNLSLLFLRYGILNAVSHTDNSHKLSIGNLETVRYIKECFQGKHHKLTVDAPRYLAQKVNSVIFDEPEPCICLTVEGDSSYISEGYVSHNSGKCIAEGEEVFKCDGSPIKIEHVKEGDKVLSVGPSSCLYEDTVTHTTSSGKKECHKVTLFDGHELIATKDHKFLSTNGFQALKDLKPNMYLATCPYPTPNHNIRWSRLKSIKKVGLRPTFDLQIEKYNNFVANGIVVHNSELVSKYFPAWYLGAFPDNQLIFSTYEAHFAAEFGGAARDLLTEYGPEVFGVNVKEGSAAASRWKIEQRLGIMQCAGVGGPLTGKGSDCLIIDDPIKNDQEAESLLMRNKIFNWFGATASTRLMPGGSIIIVMTRWHHDDLIGRLLDKMNNEGGEKYKYLKFSAIANETEEPWPKGLGRKPGEALWPEMWPIESMEKIKNSGALSSYYWSALYQQEPAPEGGGIFKQKWFRYFITQGEYYILEDDQGNSKYVDAKKCWNLITVDTANKVKDTSDYTAIGTWAITPDNDILLIDLVRDRIGYDEILKKLIHKNVYFKPRYIGIENMGIAIQLIIEARNKQLPVRELEPGGKGKQNRANMPLGAVIRMENGKVYFPKEAPYRSDIELELLTFPKAKNDEIVDILSYACNELTKFDVYDNDDFLPYALDQALPLGMRKPGGFGF